MPCCPYHRVLQVLALVHRTNDLTVKYVIYSSARDHFCWCREGRENLWYQKGCLLILTLVFWPCLGLWSRQVSNMIYCLVPSVQFYKNSLFWIAHHIVIHVCWHVYQDNVSFAKMPNKWSYDISWWKKPLGTLLCAHLLMSRNVCLET